MSSLIQLLFGSNVKTTIVGYLLAILTAIKPLLDVNATTTDIIAAAVTALITAVFGRIAADGKKVDDIQKEVEGNA